MKKKKKSSCSCIPQQDVCNDSLLNTCKPNNTCKPVNSCKKSVKKYKFMSLILRISGI